MRVEEMLAREAIRYTVGVYNAAVDGGRYDDLHRAFTADGTLAVQGMPPFEGVPAIVEALKAGAARREAGKPGNFQRHNMTSAMIEILDENNATARHYIMVITELGLDHAGIYDDEYRRDGDRWLIARRTARMEWARPDSRFTRWLGQGSPSQ